MKTFNDLKEGDYIYELDPVSGICNECIIDEITKETITFNKFTIKPNMNDSHYCILQVQYFSDKEECIQYLEKLLGFFKTVSKQIGKSIKQLK